MTAYSSGTDQTWLPVTYLEIHTRELGDLVQREIDKSINTLSAHRIVNSPDTSTIRGCELAESASSVSSPHGRTPMKLPDAPVAHDGSFVTHFLMVTDHETPQDFYVLILGGQTTILKLRIVSARSIPVKSYGQASVGAASREPRSASKVRKAYASSQASSISVVKRSPSVCWNIQINAEPTEPY
jgi:hypothetical protein